MTIAFRPLRNPNPLGFPGGVRPGFDPSHPSASNCWFSGVSGIGYFTDLLTGKLSTGVGIVTGASDGYLGPTTKYASGAAGSPFSGKPAVTFTQYTMAGIFNGPSGFLAFFSTSNNSTGGVTQLIGSGGNFLSVGAANIATGLPALVLGAPYFYVMSVNFSGGNVTINSLSLRLDTGSINTSTATAAQAAPAADNGTCYVGNQGAGFAELNQNQSCAMYSTTFMTLQQLRAWAADPWSFWYPRRDTTLVGAAAAAFKAYWAQQNNKPVIGAGTI